MALKNCTKDITVQAKDREKLYKFYQEDFFDEVAFIIFIML